MRQTHKITLAGRNRIKKQTNEMANINPHLGLPYGNIDRVAAVKHSASG